MTALILVVEDTPTVRSVLRRALEYAGHEVVVAVDGVSGLRTYHQLAHERAPDLAVVDWIMPEMNGLELARQFRTLAPNMPVLMISGDPLPREELPDGVTAWGSGEMLAKPFSMDAFVAAVATLLLQGDAFGDRQGGAAS